MKTNEPLIPLAGVRTMPRSLIRALWWVGIAFALIATPRRMLRASHGRVRAIWRKRVSVVSKSSAVAHTPICPMPAATPTALSRGARPYAAAQANGPPPE